MERRRCGQREKDAETKEENGEGAGHGVNLRISEGKGRGGNGNQDRKGRGFDGGARNRKTEETSETCERDGSESKSEDIDSWRNLERYVMKQQEMCKNVVATVTVEKEIRERMPVRGRKRANWMGFDG